MKFSPSKMGVGGPSIDQIVTFYYILKYLCRSVPLQGIFLSQLQKEVLRQAFYLRLESPPLNIKKFLLVTSCGIIGFPERVNSSSQEQVEYDPYTPDVDLLVVQLVRVQLGSHVERGPALLVAGGGESGEAEVCDFNAIEVFLVVYEDVL